MAYTLAILLDGKRLDLCQHDAFGPASRYAGDIVTVLHHCGAQQAKIGVFDEYGRNVHVLPPNASAEGTHFGAPREMLPEDYVQQEASPLATFPEQARADRA